ncbi:CRISPR-associated helicase/endonuclease Cas3 [Skermanella aerolata]|uniref:CRISPR-associated helicase/endonuclease Cas3 n=1 Tax=Skermanella aerolata TaxID=393310 RepID=A0A512E1F8_9PROT|nr:CRISPR-associated helicase/endonuclease Cas3 [Skermanella aerolata]KJB91499.1 CRISPR-associated protein Cas3 [Skermanella aerolata KACC 11604]GEO42300.1 CRISPR-associated helicase/endonuclease Cas3 [Skermanella aerolata]
MFPIPRPWAKLRRNEDGEIVSYLSLIDHSADVAAMTEALLGLPTIWLRLARLAGKQELSVGQRRRLAALAGLHDFGKANHGFQNKALDRDGRQSVPRAGHVGPAMAILLGDEGGGSLDITTRLKDRLYSMLDVEILADWCEEEVAGEGLANLMTALFAHHGSLPKSTVVEPALWESTDVYDPLAAVGELTAALRRWFPDAFAPDVEQVPTSPRFLHAFAGLVMLADWLGSDVSRFPLSGAPEAPSAAADRMVLARAAAWRVLIDRWLDPERARDAACRLDWDFASLFPEPGRQPRPLQADLLARAAPEPDSGSLLIVEAETGSGKTEAALIHFLNLLRVGCVDGLYFALPTRASAVQIHRRIRDDLHRLLGDGCPPVGLAVPGYLRVDDQDGEPLPDYGVHWPDDDGDKFRDRGWAVEQPKRFLAGAVMIGTIDQLLMGGLMVRHAQLRSAAMLRHLLVVDEVHASDPYMEELLRHVLDQHRAAGGHALLMSATLGSAARHRLTGRTDRPSAPEIVADMPFPAVTSGTGNPIEPTAGEAAPPKSVAIELVDDAENLDAVARLAVEAGKQGARVLVIVNTVRRAMELQQKIEKLAGPSNSRLLFGVAGRPCPHHARFAAEDRRLLDDALEQAFGKTANAPRIAVTTQTAEQSLDIDADLLVTDLCPADVLLQRIGRLHRHERSRPTKFETPRLVVLAPTIDVLSSLLRSDGSVISRLLGFGRTYPNLLGLAATRRELEVRRGLDLPRENRLLVEAATHPEALTALAKSLGGFWPEHGRTVIGKAIAHGMAANMAEIKWNKLLESLPEGLDGAISTRLGLDDRMAIFRNGVEGPFGREVTRIRIPGWLVPNPSAEAAPENIRVAGGSLLFDFGGMSLGYDRLGLKAT